MSTMSRVESLVLAIVPLSDCALSYQEEEAALMQPVHCSTAQSDLRAHRGDQIALQHLAVTESCTC